VLDRVVSLLRGRRVALAVIGAAAMAVHEVSRATRDVLPAGDADDPLAGVVRVTGAETPLDVVLRRPGWLDAGLARAPLRPLDGLDVPMVTASDRILLKLFAGGPQDAWDIEQRLAGGDRAELQPAVAAGLALRSSDARGMWARIARPR
jgi:hypothetical protein